MTKNKKLLPFFGRIAAMPALFLLMLFAGSQTAYAVDYDLYIGSTRVTDTNKDNIFNSKLDADGNPTAKYDPGTKTLTLNGVHIEAGNEHSVESKYDKSKSAHYSLYSGTDVVRTLHITGENSFVSKGECYYDTVMEQNISCGGGIYFSTGVPGYGGKKPEEFTLYITGDGTLTSTATDGINEGVKMGTALTVEGDENGDRGLVCMGAEDGTGPTLKLTGWEKGAYFYCDKFFMEGGTIIAKASDQATYSTGVYIEAFTATYFNGGTIAGDGICDTNENSETCNQGGAFELPYGYLHYNLPNRNHGMQRVYPENGAVVDDDIENEPIPTTIGCISGWAVVGMTSTDTPAPPTEENPNPTSYKAMTDAVMAELRLDSSTDPGTDPTDPGTDPGTGEGGGTGGGTDPGTDPTNPGTGGGSGSGSGDNSDHKDTVPGSTDIDVSGSAENTSYSVDVEWGAMTFEYEAEWNAGTHQMGDGSWKVYDTSTNSSNNDAQSPINQIKITNHSNAPVYANLSYTAETAYTDTSGTFAAPNGNTGNIKATWTSTDETNNSSGYYTLQSAVKAEGSDETVAVGNVYFTPESISDSLKTNGIKKWKKIGKITVGILTEQPQP